MSPVDSRHDPDGPALDCPCALHRSINHLLEEEVTVRSRIFRTTDPPSEQGIALGGDFVPVKVGAQRDKEREIEIKASFLD
jgi:hypothetical protein